MSGLAQFLLLGPFFHEGQIVPSPKLYHYLPGTTQEKTAWMDRGKAITAANPIEGDANGLVYGYFSGVYKLVVKTRDGSVTLFQADGVQIIDIVDEDVPATVRPEDYDGEAGAAVDNTEPLRAAIAALPAEGGTVLLGPGDYLFSGTIDCGNKNILFRGAGMDATFLTMTSASNLLHGIIGTGSIEARDFHIRTQSALTVNYQMTAIRLDLANTGISLGRAFHLSHVRVTGWNQCIYADGGASYGLERASIEHCDGVAGGPLSDYVGGVCNIHRSRSAAIGFNTFNQNHVGDHAVYCLGNQSITVLGNRIQNASRTEGQGMKIVGDGVAANQSFDRWIIRGNVVDACSHGALVSIFGTEQLRLLSVADNIAKNISGTASSVVGDLLTMSMTGTALIEQAHVLNNAFYDIGSQVIHVAGGGGARIRQLVVDGLHGVGWGRRSGGTYTALGTSTSSGVCVDKYRAKNIHVDGGGDGREIWNVNAFGGYGSEDIGSFDFDYASCSEENTTNGPFMPSINPGQATPTLRFGNRYKLTNPGAQNITGFTDMTPGCEYDFQVLDANSVLKDGANLVMAGSIDWTPNATDRFKCVALTATSAEESGRSDNT